MLRPVTIGHRFETEADLLATAGTLTGHTSGELASAVKRPAFNESPDPVGRTGVGDLVELYLGKAADNAAAPDFPQLGIEVKSLPMKRASGTWTVKEPTSITLIDYFRVAKESWPEATVRHKIQRVLWVPYEHDPKDKRRSKFRTPFTWTPPSTDVSYFGSDYETVRHEVNNGRAHLLSESMCTFLAPRRKGAKGSMRPQPFSPIAAKSRAWAFKAAYTRPILQQHVLKMPTTSLIRDLGVADALAKIEGAVEARLRGYEGWALDAIGERTGAKVAGGRSGPANFVRKLLAIKARGTIEEFEKLGVRVHTLWARPSDLRPHEAVSFPAMDLQEFGNEAWEEAEFRDHIDKILFIPLFSEERKADGSRRLGRPFFWSPTPREWEDIEREWKMYQRLVNRGRAKYVPKLDAAGKTRRNRKGRVLRENRLPGYADTTFIHMRPHGQDAEDEDIDPLGNPVTKQCFWLNPQYLQAILSRRPIYAGDR